MTKIIDNLKNATKTVTLSEIPDGTVFTGKIKGHGGHCLFKKVYQRIISLNDDAGQGVWNAPTLHVEDYQPVNITITIDSVVSA
jgi:hypothetical protein